MSHEIMQLSSLPSFMLNALQQDYIIHDHSNVKDRQVLEQVTALVGDGSSLVDRQFLSLLPNVKMISVFGQHYAGIDVATALAKGIQVSYTPDLMTDDVADMTWGLMLALARRIPQSERFLRNGDWVNEPFGLSRKVSGARLGIVGSGRLAQAIAARAKGFEMTVQYTSAQAVAQMPYAYVSDITTLASAVDFLVLAQDWRDTKCVVDSTVLRALGSRGFLINAGRAEWIDQVALMQSLKEKSIAGAGLDVFWDEPRVPSELRTLSNVVLTPRVGSDTQETWRAMADLAVANLKAFYEGLPLLTPVPESQPAA